MKISPSDPCGLFLIGLPSIYRSAAQQVNKKRGGPEFFPNPSCNEVSCRFPQTSNRPRVISKSKKRKTRRL